MAGILRSNGTLIFTVPDGRLNTQSAGKLREDGSSYWGHIHFWSPESWALFLKDQFPVAKHITTGTVNTTKLFGIVEL